MKIITRIQNFWWQRRRNLWKELQVAQGKVELLTLQTTNNWEIMAIKNETKVALYDELIKQ
jgi:hypothetical protein